MFSPGLLRFCSHGRCPSAGLAARAAALITFSFGLQLSTSSALAQSAAKVTYVDHVMPLVEQHCAKCHNPDKKKGDLDLTTHAGVLKGGGSGPVVVAGNPDGSKIIKALTHAEEPFMPPNKPPIADKELAVFRNWIAGGLLETSGSKAQAAARPSVDLTLKVSATDKPTGPAPLPRELPMESIVHTLRGGAILGLASSPWAPLVAIAGQKQILFYNTTNLDLAGILPFPDGQPVDLKFSCNGKLLLAGGGHGAKAGRAYLWEVESGRRVTMIGQEYDTVLAAALSPDQSKAAVGGPDRLIKIYSTANGELLHKIKKHTDWVTALAFSPNGEMLASADRNGGVTVWDTDNGQELFTTAGHKTAVTALSWRIDSKVIASSSEDGTVKLWESTEGKQAKTWTAHGSGVLDLAYSRDGRFVSCGRDGVVTVWDANGNKVKSMNMPGEMATRCAWTRDDSAVVAGDFTGHVSLWDAKTGRALGMLDANPPPLADRLAQAKAELDALNAKGGATPAVVVDAEKTVADLTSKLEAARTTASKATNDFRAKADLVAKLKESANQPNPPTDLEAKLAAARANRESARATNVAATAALTIAERQLSDAKAKLETARQNDSTAALASARGSVEKIEAAQIDTQIFTARDAVTSLTRQREAAQAELQETKAALDKTRRDLSAAPDAAAKAKLKTALKEGEANLKSRQTDLDKLSTTLRQQQTELETLSRAREARRANAANRLSTAASPAVTDSAH